MKKKVVLIPLELVQKLRKRIEEKYSGDLIQGVLICLNENLEILKKNGIVLLEIKNIKISSTKYIEYGSVTNDVLKNALIRVPQRGKKKLVKALIIAGFGSSWKEEYDKYYDKDGDLLQSEDIKIGIASLGQAISVRIKKLKNWNVRANHSTPQWASFLRLPLDGGIIKSVKCQLKTTSPYYRFGFKLFQLNGKLFGDGSIQSMDNNFVIHIGKNFLSEEIFITTYHNGIRQRPDKYTEIRPVDNTISMELMVNKENILHLIVNKSEIFKTTINREIRKQIYILSWGDGNEFQLNAENIVVEYGLE